jgi:C4-dicarboxylate transporter
MRNKIIVFSLFISLSIALAVVNFIYPNPLLEKATYTLVAVGIIYLVFEVLLEESILKKIKVSTTRYSLNKTLEA